MLYSPGPTFSNASVFSHFNHFAIGPNLSLPFCLAMVSPAPSYALQTTVNARVILTTSHYRETADYPRCAGARCSIQYCSTLTRALAMHFGVGGQHVPRVEAQKQLQTAAMARTSDSARPHRHKRHCWRGTQLCTTRTIPGGWESSRAAAKSSRMPE